MVESAIGFVASKTRVVKPLLVLFDTNEKSLSFSASADWHISAKKHKTHNTFSFKLIPQEILYYIKLILSSLAYWDLVAPFNRFFMDSI